jgi:hypothetical protein
VLVVLSTLGCKPLARRPVVEVSIAENLRDASVPVHVVGVRWDDYQSAWANKPVAKYWSPGDSHRENALKCEMRFGRDYPLKQVVDRDNPMWKDWEDDEVRYLLVIARIPGVDDDGKLAFDREKVGRQTIQIRVTSEGLERVK